MQALIAQTYAVIRDILGSLVRVNVGMPCGTVNVGSDLIHYYKRFMSVNCNYNRNIKTFTFS